MPQGYGDSQDYDTFLRFVEGGGFSQPGDVQIGSGPVYAPPISAGGGGDVSIPPPPPSSAGGTGSGGSVGGGGFYDTAATWLGGFSLAGSIFGSRRYKQSAFQRELIAAARRVGLSAVRGAMQALGTFERVASESRALVPFEELAPVTARGVARGALRGIGIATLLDFAFPPKLSDTDQFPLPLAVLAQGPFALQVRRMVAADQFTRSRQVPGPAVRELMSRAPDVLLGERPPTLVEKIQRLSPDLGIGRLLNPAGWTPFRVAPNATVITATAPGFGDFTPEPQLNTPADLGAGPQASSSSPGPSLPFPANAPGAATGRRLGPYGRIGLGLGFGLFAVAASRQVFSGSGPQVSTPADLNAITPIATPPAAQVSPGLGLQSLYFGGGAGGGSTGGCSCGPRGPRRKCLERAPVAWRAGRNKGKAAGSKCVRYAQRRT